MLTGSENPATIKRCACAAGVSFSDERPAALSSGRALVIDGAAQPYLRTGQTMQFTGADFTVAFWVKPAASAQGTHMSALAIHESDFAKGELLLMGESPHDLRMYHEEGANIAVRNEARAAIHRGQWQHIAWTFDANREHSTLFVNGMRVNDRRSGGIQQGSSIRGQLILGRRADSRLRGEGQFEDGTVLKLRPARRMAAIRIGGFAEPQARGNLGTTPIGIELAGSRRKIVSAYVGVGARSLELEDTSPFFAGDRIQILRPATNSWFDKLGMHNFPDRRIAWVRPDAYFEYDRHAVAVEGNTLIFDAPLPQSIDSRFGGGYVYRFEHPIEVVDCGVENLRLISNPDLSILVPHVGGYIQAAERHNLRQEFPGDNNHGWNGIMIDCASDIWVRNVTTVNFGNLAVGTSRDTRRITIQDSACLDPVSPKRGGNRYSFAVSGQQTLVQRCYTRGGRHDFVIGAWTRGPNAFVDSVSDFAWNLQEPHHRWGMVRSTTTSSRKVLGLVLPPYIAAICRSVMDGPAR